MATGRCQVAVVVREQDADASVPAGRAPRPIVAAGRAHEGGHVEGARGSLRSAEGTQNPNNCVTLTVRDRDGGSRPAVPRVSS